MGKPQNALGSTWGVPTAATPLVPTAEPLGQKSQLPKPSGLNRLQQRLVAGMEKRAHQEFREHHHPPHPKLQATWRPAQELHSHGKGEAGLY